MRKIATAVLGFLLIINSTLFAQSKTKGQRISFDDSINIVGLAEFDSSFKNKRVFFTGEDHRFIESNNNFSFAFTKYLNENYGVRHILLELGSTWGNIVNTYIQTGDSSIFEVIKKSSYVAYHDYFTNLYKYNKSLPDSQKITVSGIDVTRDYAVCVHYMSYLIPEKINPPDEIIVSVESTKALSSYLSNLSSAFENTYSSSTYSYYNTIDSIISNFYAYQEEYKSFLDSHFNKYSKVIRCIEDNKVWHNYDNNYMIQKFIFREQFMLKEFEKLLNQYPNEKFYGQFGRCHIGLSSENNECDWYNFRPIAKRISEINDNELADKVLSIAIIYNNGLIYKDKLPELVVKLIDETPKNNIYIYPYNSGIEVVDSSYIEPNKYNYVIIDKKSKIPVSLTDSGPIYSWISLKNKTFRFSILGYSYDFSFNPNINSNDLNEIHRKLVANPLFKDFDLPIESQTFSLERVVFRKKSGFGWGIDYGNIIKQTRDIDTGVSVKFGGFSMSGKLSFNKRLLTNNLLWLYGNLRLGYNEKYLILEYPTMTRPPLLGFDNIETTKFKTSYYSLSPVIGFSVMVWNTFLIGAESGYHIQNGNTQWKEGKNKIKGPKQSWTNLFYSVKVAWAIMD